MFRIIAAVFRKNGPLLIKNGSIFRNIVTIFRNARTVLICKPASMSDDIDALNNEAPFTVKKLIVYCSQVNISSIGRIVACDGLRQNVRSGRRDPKLERR